MIALCKIRPAKEPLKIEKPLSSGSLHPQFELKTSRSSDFDRDLKRIALCRIRPAKESLKIEKPLFPGSLHPQSELKTSQSSDFDRDYKGHWRERRKTTASYQELLEEWPA